MNEEKIQQELANSIWVQMTVQNLLSIAQTHCRLSAKKIWDEASKEQKNEWSEQLEPQNPKIIIPD